MGRSEEKSVAPLLWRGRSMRLSGKTAIVTGAGTGIGFAIASRFAKEGGNVVIADISNFEERARALSSEGYSVIGLHADVSSEESAADMVDKAISKFGAVDILVNNAAISAGLTL